MDNNAWQQIACFMMLRDTRAMMLTMMIIPMITMMAINDNDGDADVDDVDDDGYDGDYSTFDYDYENETMTMIMRL